MGVRLGDQDGYPAGVDNSHPHFHQAAQDECPECGEPIGDDVCCPECGAVLDEQEAAYERADYMYDLQRDMERER